jgi:hypothetical protein
MVLCLRQRSEGEEGDAGARTMRVLETFKWVHLEEA